MKYHSKSSGGLWELRREAKDPQLVQSLKLKNQILLELSKNITFSLENDGLGYRTFYIVIFGYFTENFNKHPHVLKSCAVQNLSSIVFVLYLVQNLLQL